MPHHQDDAAAFMAAIVESSDDAIVSKDLNSIVTSWNAAAERIFGFTAAEMIGQSIRRIIPDDRQSEEDEVLGRLRRGERIENYETIRKRKDGREIPVSLTVSPIRNASGRVVGASKIARDMTEREKVRAEAARARTFSERIAHTSPDVLFVYDLEAARYVFVNPRVQDVFGCSPREFSLLAGADLEQVIPASDLAAIREMHQRLDDAPDETVVQYEHRIKRADGELRDVRVRAAVFARTPAGRASQIIGHLVDVTESKAAQERERDLQARLQVLVSASASALTTPRLDAVLPAALSTAQRLVAADGYALWRYLPRSDVWRAASSHGLSAQFTREVGTQVPPNSPLRRAINEPLIVHDVEEIPDFGPRLEVYRTENLRSLLAVPLKVSGELSGTLVFYYRERHASSEVDVQVASALANFVAAAIRSAELYEDLQRAERASAFLARASAILTSSLDYEATLKRVAQVAVPDIADWCAVDIVRDGGRLDRLAIAHADPDKVALALELQRRYPEDPEARYGAYEVLRTKAPVMMARIPDELLMTGARDADHLKLLRQIGLHSYMCVPLLSRGEVLGVLTLVSAESGRAYSEADLHFAEEIASRASLAIENAYVYEEARQANMLKDEFLATLSHELRTPLNAVLGYTRMLRSGLVPPDREAQALGIVERNANSLAQLVEDVLDVSRIIAGKIRLNVQPVDLLQVVRDAVASVEPAAEAKGVRILSIADSEAPQVSGDPDRLQQVVWNLLSNAVKFTPRGGRVQIRLERVDSQVEIVVADSGVGIRAEFLPHVFERFRQADSRFSREHGGLGLGLAIARHIVEMHGGTIHAASGGEGEGATFRVRLPIRAAHSERHAERDRVHPSTLRGDQPAVAHALRGIRVLVVDDDQESLALIRDILDAAGATVRTARSGAEALVRLRESVPDVLVTDIGMPQMDGFELIHQIRNLTDPAVRDMPAAALTAYARSDDRRRALTAGFHLHLSKPVEPGELIAAVLRLAADRRRDPNSRPSAS